ncbi:MAG: hypothetical protein M3Q07_19960 [Pseudobdellovibrionaceae bacterium]|nr:hypothetical protein [Pseudobdellovibrionaceae bacterium]
MNIAMTIAIAIAMPVPLLCNGTNGTGQEEDVPCSKYAKIVIWKKMSANFLSA